MALTRSEDAAMLALCRRFRGDAHARSRSRHPQRHRGDRGRQLRLRRRRARAAASWRSAERLPRGRARDRCRAASWSCRAASTAIAISSSSRAWGSGTPTISRAARVSAAFGGTTTVIPFAAQHRGQSMVEVVADYRERAKKAVIDHAFHMIVSDPSEQVMARAAGADPRRLHLAQAVHDLSAAAPGRRADAGSADAGARASGAMVSVHAENDAMIGWMVERLLARGHTAPRYHAVSHPRLAEAEAVNRADRDGGAGRPAGRGVPRHDRRLDERRSATPRPAARRCSPRPARSTCCSPQRTSTARARGRQVDVQPAGARCRPITRRSGAACGTAPSRWSPPTTRPIASMRPASSPRAGRASSSRSRTAFPASSCACRCCSRKGSARADRPQPLRRAVLHQPGQDLWAASARRARSRSARMPTSRSGTRSVRVEVTDATTHDATGYCPYAGMTLTGWPVTVIARGEVIVDGGELLAERGRGRFLPRPPGQAARPSGRARAGARPGAQLRRRAALRRGSTMARRLRVAAAQLGPIHLARRPRGRGAAALRLLREAHGMGARLVVFPELALTTFFPRYWYDDVAEIDAWFEREMPNAATAPLFDLAKDLGVGFYLGYAELALEQGAMHRYNTSSSRTRRPHRRQVSQGAPAGPRRSPRGHSVPAPREALLRGRQSRLPGLARVRFDRRHDDLQRPPLAGGVPRAGPAGRRADRCSATTRRRTTSTIPSPGTCGCSTTASGAGRRLPERLLGGVDRQGRRGGRPRPDRGSCIIAPTGEIMAQAISEDDEVIVFDCDLDLCRHYKTTVFAFEQHRRIEHYGLITAQTGIVPPP